MLFSKSLLLILNIPIDEPFTVEIIYCRTCLNEELCQVHISHGDHPRRDKTADTKTDDCDVVAC